MNWSMRGVLFSRRGDPGVGGGPAFITWGELL